ncbi:MAG: ABC transporter permease [Candidatus Omnitrophica bacterium]|nr:ABC transporter permease [Candidatus Omnitrophota bacterium]
MWNKVKELIARRELIIRLALKDLRVQYRRPLLGFLWAFFMPLATIIIFQIVFSKILRVPVGEYPFFIYLMTAIFPWRFFQAGISRSTTSILDSRNLIREASFPRELIPISIIVAELINFIPSLFIMLIFLVCFKINFSFLIFYLPLVIFLHTFLILGISLIVASLQVKFRDIRYVVEIVLLGLFYLTPVFYPISLVAQSFNQLFLKIYLANPLVGILNLYRIILLKGFSDTLPSQVNIFNSLVVPIIWSFCLFFLGFYIFKKREKHFSDYLLI